MSSGPATIPAAALACEAADAADPLAFVRDRFRIPEDVVYLDGNSLGPLPAAVPEAVRHGVEAAWGRDLIRSWNEHDWIGLPRRLGDRLAPLMGAAPGTVLVCDSISVNLYKLLAAALELRPGRPRIVATQDQFPTDLYLAEGLARLLGPERCELVVAAPEAVPDAIDDRTAAVLLSQVDFRSGALRDLPGTTAAIRDRGALAVWDLAHSAGVLPLALDADAVDLAVGCTYKYLNGGPGAPAWLYVPERHQHAMPALPGWMGHAAPFAFETAYRPAPGIERWLTGTPPILSLLALEAALTVWDGVELAAVRGKAMALTDRFVREVRSRPALAELVLRSPERPEDRGSQVAFAHPDGYAMVQALASRGVIADFRAPDLLRFGFSPLYLSHGDVRTAVDRLEAVVSEGAHRDPVHRARARVT